MASEAWRIGFEKDWAVVGGTERSQAAFMEIKPGDAEGGAGNRHPGDQWMIVLEGNGRALIGGETHKLEPNTLLLIPAGQEHKIECVGTAPLRTVNIYAPPAYGPGEG